MPSMQRLVSAAVLLALCSVLTGCGGAASWDPMDMLDFLDTKRKLPGDRKPVFPEGVPGLEQGVPKELYKDNVEREQQQEAAAAAAPAPAPAAPEPKAKRKSHAHVNVGAVHNAPGEPDAAAAEDGSTAAAPPAPKKKIVRRRTTTPPADDQNAAPAAAAPADQSSQQPATAPFPAPVPSGSFSR